MRKIVAVKRVLYDALGHFNDDDGWSMASHLAITALMALFPFLIFATTLASFLGAEAFADTAVHLVFDTWPEQIAAPIAREVVNVLTVQRTDLLTYGVLLAAFFASNGIEALRTSLNRAYRVTETRAIIYRRRAEPRLRADRHDRLRGDQRAAGLRAAAGAAGGSQFRLDRALYGHDHAVALRHRLDGDRARPDRRPLSGCRPASAASSRIVPGIIFTLIGWLVGSTMFATYLDHFSSYVTTYAGLASIMIAVVFLYIVSAIFILGGELNAAISRYLEARARVRG